MGRCQAVFAGKTLASAWGAAVKVLAVGAHPDDIEFMCAGTLFLLREAGFAVRLATVSAGDCGSAELPPDEIMAIRAREAEEAAALLDAPYTCLDERDCRIFLGPELLAKVVEEVRRADPDIVFTHFPQDYMVDHEETSRAVRSAAFSAPMPNFSTGLADPAPPIAHVPHLYYWAPMELKDILGRPAPSQFYVDVGPVMERKREMLACHRSQRDWLLKQHGVDEYLNAMVESAKGAGALAGLDYAEGFTQHRGHAYPSDNVLAEYVKVTAP